MDKECIARLEKMVNSEFERMEYGEAIDRLLAAKKKFEFPVEWGCDLQSEHERYLTEEVVGAPMAVVNYPTAIKAFYMRLNDDERTVAAMDVLAPGIGEIIGGSQREERLDVLDRRIEAMGVAHRGLLVVPRPTSLRHRAACRLRPGLRARHSVRDRHREHPRRDPVPTRAAASRLLIAVDQNSMRISGMTRGNKSSSRHGSGCRSLVGPSIPSW